jgi:hypothetical protein
MYIRLGCSMISRRMLLNPLIITLSISSIIKPRRLWAETNTGVNIVWRIPEAQVQEVRNALGPSAQVTVQRPNIVTRGLPLLLVVGTVALSELARALLTAYRDLRYGGILVTTQNGALNIQNDSRLPEGTIIVSDQRGVEVYRTNNLSSIEELTKALAAITRRTPRG